MKELIMSIPKLLIYCFLLLRFFNLTATNAQVLDFIYNICSTRNNFTANSAYQFNLNTLMFSMSSSATEFYDSTSGGNTNDPVYGLFMCRGDVSYQLCNDCVNNATDRIDSNCPYSIDGFIWYDQCYVCYSNSSSFPNANAYLINTVNTSSVNFTRVLAKALSDVVAEAAKSGRKFATHEVNINQFENIYCLAQCTPDLSTENCNSCLQDVLGDFPMCCLGKEGGRVLTPRCNLRYESYRFYSNLSAQAPTPSILDSGSRTSDKGKGTSHTLTITMVVMAIVVLLICCVGCYIFRRKKMKNYNTILKENFGSESNALESLQFDLETIEVATNKFAHHNRIGKGGFGEVYKGILPDQREVAVKRLSKNSGQGIVQFKNEVLLIAKLQHRNLVALLGFCLEEHEKILIYEYVPNHSLDYFLFGSKKQRVLTWMERYKIIGGIARGILYLHEYSRLKVIHRDLKPSNILLDDNMNAKVSDFGLARMVNIDETQGNTNRIVGTYGYMSPEYAMFGQFSEKSDVFSFGVMTLEIISGKRNGNSFVSQHSDRLLSYAWQQWRDEKPLEIIDPNLEEDYPHIEVINCIQIGLLCVQENPDARPPMATVVSYLSNHSIQLPFPKEPAFFMHNGLEPNPTIGVIETNSDPSIPSSINEASISTFFPR